LEAATWLSLCTAICQREWSIASSSMSVSPAISLVSWYSSAHGSSSCLTEAAEDNAVIILEYLHQNHITPKYFAQIVDLALVSNSSKIRQVCHQAILGISFGGPNVVSSAGGGRFRCSSAEHQALGPNRKSKLSCGY